MDRKYGDVEDALNKMFTELVPALHGKQLVRVRTVQADEVVPFGIDTVVSFDQSITSNNIPFSQAAEAAKLPVALKQILAEQRLGLAAPEDHHRYFVGRINELHSVVIGDQTAISVTLRRRFEKLTGQMRGGKSAR